MLPTPWGRVDQSQGAIGLVPVPPAWERELREAITREYGAHAGEITEIRQIAEHGGSLNFRVGCAGRPPLLFKVHRRVDDPAVLAVLLDVQRWLYDAGVLDGSPERDAMLPLPSVARFPRGCPLVYGRSGQEAYLAAYRYVDGATHFGGASDAELASVAFELGRIQRALAALPASVNLGLIRRNRTVLPPFKDLAASYAALRGVYLAAVRESAAARALAEADGVIAGAVTRALAVTLDAPEVAPNAAVYGDFHTHNTLVRDGRVVLIYDYEGCTREPTQEPSLAFAVHRFTREWAAHDPGRAVAGGVALFLEHYQRGGGRVDPGFAGRLPAYIRDGSLRKLCYMARTLLAVPASPEVETQRLGELAKFITHLREVAAYDVLTR